MALGDQRLNEVTANANTYQKAIKKGWRREEGFWGRSLQLEAESTTAPME